MSEAQLEERPSIVIVDDAAEVRTLVRTRLRLSGRLDVVAEGGDGADAVALAQQHQPDLMLLDVSMPGMDGLEALPRVLEVSPATKVAMFSGFEEQGLAQRLTSLGAAVFLQKSASLDSLADDLVAVLGEDQRGTTPSVPLDAASGADERRVIDEHLERFRELFEEAAIGMATLTLSGQVVRANRALAALVDRPVEELVGTPYAGLTGAERPEVEAALAEVQGSTVDVLPIEHTVVGSDDRRVLTTMTPIRDSGGRPLYLFLQVQDVSATRTAQQQLRLSEDRFRLLVGSVRDHAIFMLDPHGRIASWNAGAQRIKGYSEDEIVGRHFSVFYPREVAESGHPERELEIALREGRYEEEGWRIRKDGSRFWADVVISAVHDEDGHHVGFAKVTRDMSSRREAEERLRQSEERFRRLVQAVRDYAIFMLDPQGHIMSWNAGAERINGWSADEIIGRHFRVFYPEDKRAERHPEHELELALRDGHYEEEGWRVRKDGTRFWSHVTITTVRDQHGAHVGFTKVTRDTTERRQMLQQQEEAAAALAEANTRLQEANERLQQAADDQAKFLAVTAHELRNPVSVLGGTADTLMKYWEQLDDEERKEMLDGMSSSAVRLRRLLGDLLTASRLQNSALQIERHPVEAGDLVDRAVATASRTHPDAEVTATAEPGLWVDVDADRLAQALDNLVTNAVRHGAPPIRLTAGPGDPDPATGTDTVSIRVSDAGAGITEAMQERLFERFATGRARGGTGLGLYIVRELARAHGGDATYDPGTGTGTGHGAFVLTLPRVAAP